jgi:hypothetical protein
MGWDVPGVEREKGRKISLHILMGKLKAVRQTTRVWWRDV